MHIDMLVIYDGRWIPIELKYKLKVENIICDWIFNLKRKYRMKLEEYLNY
jgi:hypothetical protein